MPIYEYQCQTCGRELEALQKVNDAPLEKCPECGEMALKKKVTAAAFRLKGGGWYETDFKTGDKKNIAGGADKAAATAASDNKSSAGSTDSKSST